MSGSPHTTAVHNGGAPCFSTPTPHSTAFSATDAELAAITADVAQHEHAFVRPQRHHRRHHDSGSSAHSTPVRVTEVALPHQRRLRKSHSPSTPIRDCFAYKIPVSPRQRRCAGPIFNDMEALCGSPRVHLAVPSTAARQVSREVSQLSDWGCFQRTQDSLTDLLAVRTVVSARESCGGSEVKTTTPSLASTPVEHGQAPMSPRGDPLPISYELLPTEDSSVANKSFHPPSSPSFSFFSNVGERRSSRPTTKVDSPRNTEGRHFVSPRSFALRTSQSQWGGGDAAAASLSSSTLPTEVKVFSPLRFDMHAVSSTHSQGLSSVTPSHFSSLPFLAAQHSVSQFPSEDEKELASAGDCATPSEVQDIVKQQRLLHACVLAIAREKRGLTAEVQRLRRRRLSVLVHLLLHVLLRLPLRVLSQFFVVCTRKAKRCFTRKHEVLTLCH